MSYTSRNFRGETASRAVKIRWKNQIEKYRILKLNNLSKTKKSLIEWQIISSFLNFKNDLFLSRRSYLKNLGYSQNKSIDWIKKQNLWYKKNNPISKFHFNPILNLKQNKKYKNNFKNQLNKNIYFYSFISNFLSSPIIFDHKNLKNMKSLKIINEKNQNKKQFIIKNYTKKFHFQDFNYKNSHLQDAKVAVRFVLSGRLNGVRMKRKFSEGNGNISSQTYSINSNYIQKNIYTKWGILGLRIWNRRLSNSSTFKELSFKNLKLKNPERISVQQFLKKYKPVTPSLRHRLILKSLPSKTIIGKNQNLWKENEFNKRTLIKGIKKTSGRNNHGRITSFRKGGGHKKLYRQIDFLNYSSLYSKAEVINIEKNPFSNANIALLKVKSFKQKNHIYKKIKKFFYIIAPEQLQIGDELKGLYYTQIVKFFPHLILDNPLGLNQKIDQIDKKEKELHLYKQKNNKDSFNSFKPGELYFLKDIPVGTYINNVEIQQGKGSQIARSAGTYCVLLKILEKSGSLGGFKCLIKLPSNQIIEVDSACTAHIGQVSNSLFKSTILGKAGASRWLGIRPRTRGEAMNPVDHPHGGKSHGPGGLRNQPKNRWGKLAKWQPTSSKSKRMKNNK